MPRGTCVFCGQERSVNSKGLCPSCKDVVPCAVHEELLTVQKCKVCRKPACGFCAVNGICTACRESRATVKAEAPRASRREPLTEEERALRVKIVAGVAALLVLGGVNYWIFGPAPLPPDQEARQTMQKLGSAVRKYAEKHGAAPKSLAELKVAADEAQQPLPTLIPLTARPIPQAIACGFDGKHCTLHAFTPNGKLLSNGGHVVEIKAP